MIIAFAFGLIGALLVLTNNRSLRKFWIFIIAFILAAGLSGLGIYFIIFVPAETGNDLWFPMFTPLTALILLYLTRRIYRVKAKKDIIIHMYGLFPVRQDDREIYYFYPVAVIRSHSLCCSNIFQMTLLTISLAPVLVILVYIYFRDKYEKEPIGMLLKGLIAGVLITIPIIIFERTFSLLAENLTGLYSAAYDSFIVAALTEESLKFLAVYLLIWRSREFNERFDGIVYAVFVSLGFAAVENVLYVFDSGMQTGILRALTAVPAHALFGITMGFYLGLARFIPDQRKKLLFKAFLYPIIIHGIYDFLILSGHPVLLILFIPYLIFLWIYGSKKLNRLSASSNPDLS
jgi:RsiW-degrading membrane proteinase PrsW (M82 family)